MKKRIVLTLAAALALAGCGLLSFRMTTHGVRRLQKAYAHTAPKVYEYVEPPAPANPAEERRAFFAYHPREYPFPRRLKRTRPEYRVALLPETAARAMGSAFIDEEMQFKEKYVLEFDNVAVTLDGFNEAWNAGFIYVTDRNMPVGPFGVTPRIKSYISIDEVYAIMDSPFHILILSSEDDRFLFEAGMNEREPQLGEDRILENRNRALGRLYACTRRWLKHVKRKERAGKK